jgi:DNA polymerase elongation subunit (family B)
MDGYGDIEYLFLDIESLPSGESNFEELPTEADYVLENMKSKDDLRKQVPKSYKKEETIDKWVEEEFAKQNAIIKENYQKLIDECDKEYRSRSLNSLKGRIFCISYAVNDEEPKCVTFDPSEERMMEKFELALKNDIGERRLALICWVGHNVKGFDIKWLAQRAMKYRRKDLLRWIPSGKWDKRVMDTNELFNLFTYGNYTKLDDIAKFFCLEGKGDMSGDKVYDEFMEGNYDKIHEYCIADVELTRNIFNIIMHGI